MDVQHYVTHSQSEMTKLSPLSAGPGYIKFLILVTEVPADALAPNGARPSAGTWLTTKLCMFYSKFPSLTWFLTASLWSNVIIQNFWQDLDKSDGTTSVRELGYNPN